MTDTTPKAIVVIATGLVLNLVAGSDVILPSGCSLVDIGPGAEPGGTYADGVFTPVPQPPASVSGDAIIGAISKADAAKIDVRDLARIAYRDDVPAGNAKLGRIAKAIGTTPDALRAAASA